MTAAPRADRDVGIGADAVVEPAERLALSIAEVKPGAGNRRPVLWRSWTRCDVLPGIAELDAALNHGMLRFPFVSMHLDGSPSPVGSYTESRSCGGAEHAGYADYDRVIRLLDAGYSLEIGGMRYWSPQCRTFAHRLAELLGAEVDAQASIAPAGRGSLPARREVHDVVVIQLANQRRWVVFEDPPDGQPSTEPARAALEVMLEPGDVMYIPAGSAHVVAAAEGHISYHMTLSLHWPTVDDLVVHLMNVLGSSHPARDTPLGGDEASALAADFITVTKTLLETISSDPELTEVGVARARRGRVPTDGRFIRWAHEGGGKAAAASTAGG